MLLEYDPAIKQWLSGEKNSICFFFNNCFLIEEAISHSEIICIEISIILYDIKFDCFFFQMTIKNRIDLEKFS